MDDFRVGSIPSYDPSDRQEQSGSRQKKSRRPKDQVSGQDDVAIHSQDAETESEPLEDFYSPSDHKAE